MGKFNTSAGGKGRVLDLLAEQAQAELPAAPQPGDVAPAPEPGPTPQQATGPAPEALPITDGDLTGAIDAGVEQGAAIQAEEDRQTIPNLNERAKDDSVKRWAPHPVQAAASISPDGQLRARARAMSAAVDEGLLLPNIKRSGPAYQAVDVEGKTQQEGADAIAAETEGSLTAAINRSGAVVENKHGQQVPNPRYVQVASAVTENMLADLSFGEDTDINLEPEIDQVAEDKALINVKAEEGAESPRISRAQGNANLGQQIHAEYQRLDGVNVPEKLPQKEAETLGDAFKNLWAEQNPTLVNKFVDPVTRQGYFQLTAEGQKQFENGSTERKRLFPKVNVRPAKTSLPGGQLPGDVGQTATKKASGRVGEVKFGNVINNAVKNMATVPNVVDKQRGKILLATILPVLASGDNMTWQAEINNMGPSKVKKYAAAAKDQERRRVATELEGQEFKEEVYDPVATLDSLVDKIAQEVRAVATERKGANFLTYSIQGFNGRISPQQTGFNPTSSKAVRFVTRNATPSMANPGSRVEKNLRQMYAMMLVKGADSKLPPGREIALQGASGQLEAWGDRLEQALTMTDAEYEAVSDAITEGMALTDPNFPKFGGLDLDPDADAELISTIESKGEDGPHFIDGLMDFAKYAKAKKAGKPHASYFNAYIDGKTNGLASNGIQMGSSSVAESTGVIRKNVNQLLDTGDIRDQLRDIGIESVRDGWDGVTDGFESELNDVATRVFQHRDLNKATTMTFGYGKEISSFVTDIEEAMGLIAETSKDGDTFPSSLAQVEEHMTRTEIAQMILDQKYEPALKQVLSDDAIDTRALMRGSAMLHAATNQLMSIKSYTGMDLNLGRNESTGAEGATETAYRITSPDGSKKKQTALHYETEATSSAPRVLSGKSIPGEYAYGGSLPGPVQSLDAATVAMTASGKSWEKLKAKSMGNPYLHTIYDAFKMDANGYDTIMEEVNKNWLDATMNWSYLEQTQNSTKAAMMKFSKEIKKRPPNEKLSKNERLYMDYLLEIRESSSGRPIMGNFINKIGKVVELKDPKDVFELAKKLESTMGSVGYDVNDPPAEPTVQQLKAFTFALADMMQLSSRFSYYVDKTNANKKELKREILRRGHTTPSGEKIALQYYAH